MLELRTSFELRAMPAVLALLALAGADPARFFMAPAAVQRPAPMPLADAAAYVFSTSKLEQMFFRCRTRIRIHFLVHEFHVLSF